ncbi:hypothetical protein FRB99_007343 [Tulasnella sp. 403]|nr:hypothetical protein FRB99_007343 [Tulasnella sp. 403]
MPPKKQGRKPNARLNSLLRTDDDSGIYAHAPKDEVPVLLTPVISTLPLPVEEKISETFDTSRPFFASPMIRTLGSPVRVDTPKWSPAIEVPSPLSIHPSPEIPMESIPRPITPLVMATAPQRVESPAPPNIYLPPTVLRSSPLPDPPLPAPAKQTRRPHAAPPPSLPSFSGYQMFDDANTGPRLSTYTENRRDLLDILKSLHSTGVQNELDLPQIVVVGSQSVGKSSLIESMSGLSLPRDTGTCTRLRFHVDSSGRPLMDIREVAFGDTLYDKREVVRMIRRAQRAILRPTLDASVFLDDSDLGVLGHPAQSFSANCVCIHVTGPQVPDLYFYDLPGIIANVKDSENEGDIQLVEGLAKSYINRPNSIVLLVISCETDFENQGAGRLVFKDDELRRRTVGVLTKVDRIEFGGTSRWLRILRNEENALKNGWYCVKQPDMIQLQAGISWEDAQESERSFFQDTQPWSTLERRYRQRLGSEPLAENLGVVLSNLAARKLPEIQKEVALHLLTVNDELRDMPPPNLKDPRRDVINLLRDFTNKVSKHIEGLPPSILPASSPPLSKTTEHSPVKVPLTKGVKGKRAVKGSPVSTTPAVGSAVAGSLMYTLHEAFERFRTNVHCTAPCFRPWSSDVALDRSVESQLISAATEDDPPNPRGINELYLDQVWQFSKKSRTRELPGNYPFAVKERLIMESVRHWRTLADECFKEVQKIVIEYVEQLIREHLSKYSHGGLLETVSRVAREQIRESARATLDKIEGLCRTEDEPYTQNEHYFFYYQSKLLQRYRLIHRRSLGQGDLFMALKTYDPTARQHCLTPRYDGSISILPVDEKWEYINNVITNLSHLGIRGVVAEDLAKMFKKEDMEPALEIMAEVRAYFQVAFKRFTDNVPKQIDTHFVRAIDTDLDLALRYLDLSEAQCREWLREPDAIVEKRNDLIGRRNRLEAAQLKLPGIQDKISRQLHIVKEELSEMNPPDFKDPRREIINLLRDFNKKLTKHIEGLPSGILQSLPHQVSNGSSNAGSLIYTLHEAFERFRVDIHRTAPAFRPWSSKDNIGSDLTKQLIACAAEDDAVESRNINKLYLDQNLVEDRTSDVAEFLNEVLVENLEGVTENLYATSSGSVTRKVEVAKGGDGTSTSDPADGLLDDQLRAYELVTRHPNETAAGNNPPRVLLQIHGEPETIRVGEPVEASAAWHMMSARTFAATPFTNTRHVRGQVAYKRFTDNIPKEIDTDFVRVIDTDLDLALRCLDLSEAQCREWLKEPPPVTDRRNESTGKKNRLDAAQAKLMEFFRSNRPDLALVMFSIIFSWIYED